MIGSFRDQETEKVYRRQRCRRFSGPLARAALKKLLLIDAAEAVEDLRAPPNRLEKLSGDREGTYSIRINERWRVCFAWRSGQAEQVEIVDYH